MKNKKAKKTLIIAIITVMIIIIASIIALVINRNKEKEPSIVFSTETSETTGNIINTGESNEIENTKQEINISEDKYYMLSDIVARYYATINKNSYRMRDGTTYYDKDTIKEQIRNILSEEYIEKNNITTSNLYNYIPDIQEVTTFIPKYMKADEGIGVDKYFINGILIYTLNANKEPTQVNLFVNIDNENKTYSIEPITENITDLENVEINNTGKQIEDKSINKYTDTQLEEKEKAMRTFNEIKLLLQRKSKDLYDDMLDKEYRDKKFGSYESYLQYVNENYEKIDSMVLSKYNITEENNYTQYVFIDNYGKYYIFRIKNANDRTILLDTYTVDLPEFIKKYNNAKDQEKVGLNVEKFISAVNDEDYKFAYDLLDEVFKQNNMPTQEDFENFVKTNFYKNNIVEHNEVNKQGDTYIYGIGLKNADNEEDEEKEVTIIMKLEEETKFVMSLSMNN